MEPLISALREGIPKMDLVAETAAMADGLPRPHLLVDAIEGGADYYVTVESVSELDKSLDALDLIPTTLTACVLPATPIADCRKLMEAVEKKDYQGIQFQRVGTPHDELDVLTAKLEASVWIEDAKKCVQNANAEFKQAAAVANVRLSQWGEADPPQPHKNTAEATKRAQLGQLEWQSEVQRVLSMVYQANLKAMFSPTLDEIINSLNQV